MVQRHQRSYFFTSQAAISENTHQRLIAACALHASENHAVLSRASSYHHEFRTGLPHRLWLIGIHFSKSHRITDLLVLQSLNFRPVLFLKTSDYYH